jgi:hypothetical protein
VEAGTVAADGFSQIEITLGGEFKEGVPPTGTIGALLVPDTDPFLAVFRTEGKILAALEVKVEVKGGGRFFISREARARVAFPRYRVFLYDETNSGAAVWVYVYRSRC